MTVIVLGADTPIGLAIIRELGSRDLTVHAIGRTDRSIGGASRFAATRHVRPRGPIADWLPGLIGTTGATALMAVSEGDLVALAQLPEVVDGCRILTPRAGPLAIVLDKQQTLDRAARLGFDIPATWQPAVADDCDARAAHCRFPVVLKWPDPVAIMPQLDAHGIAFEKAEFVMDMPGLVAALRRYDALAQWPIVQDYCPGHGLGQMLMMHGGTATLRFQHRRLHEWPPEGGVSTWCEAVPSDDHASQMAKSEALLAAIGWEGPAMVEYRHDAATGRYWLMEINGRLWGSMPLASACGATFAWAQYRARIDGDATAFAACNRRRRARYMIPETRRLARVWLNAANIRDPLFRNRPLRDLVDYVAGFIDPRTRYYVWQWQDPGPFLRDMANIVSRLWRRGSP